MISDVNFLQKYNDIVLENFNAVLKQNLLFQTQISVLEEKVVKANDYEQIKTEVSRLSSENNDLRNELHHKNMTLENNISSDATRHRLQTALNNEMKERKKFEDLYTKNQEYIKQLEEMLPNSKRKKLGLEVEEVKQKQPLNEDSSTITSVAESSSSVIEELAGGNF